MQFDLFGRDTPGVQPVVAAAVASNRLDEYAFLYTASEKGNNSGIRFAMTRDDAIKWCSSPVSRGVLHGTQWAYFWTSVTNFISCHWGAQEPKIIIKGLVDNGRWDERIAAAGCVKIGFPDFRCVFGPLGVKVVE